MMSDNFMSGLIYGNSMIPHGNSYPCKRRLVEECEEVSVSAIQARCGKKALITAIRQARPLRLQLPGGDADVWLIEESHRLPGPYEGWSSLEAGNARVWFVCPGCRKRVGKLHYFYFAPDSMQHSDLLCRCCHGLVYQSQNCGGNRWYRETARPLKRLLQEKCKLQAKQQTQRIATRLAEIENEICTLRQKVKLKARHRREGLSSGMRPRERRPYRNLDLLEQWGANELKISAFRDQSLAPILAEPFSSPQFFGKRFHPRG
jgi:hypothetical protein